MTLKEAIKIVNSRSRNINLQWFVYKFNKGYAIATSNEVIKHNIDYVYGTGDPQKNWKIHTDNKGKRTHHVKN